MKVTVLRTKVLPTTSIFHGGPRATLGVWKGISSIHHPIYMCLNICTKHVEIKHSFSEKAE